MSNAPNFWNKFRSLARFSQRKSPGAKQNLQRRLSLETLEQRRVLSVSPNQIALNNSNLTIYGSADPDFATVSELGVDLISVRLESGGESITQLFTKSQIGRIVFFGRNGDDSFTNATNIKSRAFGEGGNDTLIGGSAADEMDGGAGNDFISGGDGDDVVQGNIGDDTVHGDAGNDTVTGGDGNDVLTGGDGNDLIYSGTGNDIANGGQGNDKIFGDAGNDTLNGGDGDDQLLGGDGDDRIRGGTGNDILYGQLGSDYLWGDDGNDILLGHDGNDLLRGGHGNDELRGGNGNDFLEGDQDNDKLFGEAGADTLTGEEGDDVLFGGDGDDRLMGGTGNDMLYGELGDDFLWGDDGNDILLGQDGNDVIRGGRGSDELRGGSGNDLLEGDQDSDKLYGEEGADTLTGEEGDDLLFGGDGDDRLIGGTGNDMMYGELGDDSLWGDDGNDILLGHDGNDFLRGGRGSDELRGGNGNDLLDGDQDSDKLFGEGGADTLTGDDGDDVLFGGDGDDRLMGGTGNDMVYGELGDDSLWGDDGNDILLGHDGNDVLRGGNGNDELRGGSGSDFLEGHAGKDKLFGETGDDLLSGGIDDDYLMGGGDNDILLGDAGNDYLGGEGGADILVGGEGVDSLYGSAGDDLLIGGIVIHDAAKLKLLSSVWASNASYSERIQAIEDESFAAFLRIEETVFDDYIPDSVSGGLDLDWLFVPGAMSVYDPVGHGHEDQQDQGDSSHHHGAHVINHLPVVEGFALLDSLDKITDAESNEKVSTIIPHGDNPSKRTEHIGLFELVRYDQVTHYAIASGNWSDPSIWQGGLIPTSGARVLIPLGVEVTVNQRFSADIFTIRVDGKLSFATNVNTLLKVDTMIVSDVGSLEIGTEANPIAPNVNAELRFTNTGPINRNWDPYGISRGLITHGSVNMHGAAKTSSAELIGPVLAGSSVLTLWQVPTGWKVGDYVVIAGTSTEGDQSEVRQVLAMLGNTIVVSPLQYSHQTNSASQQIHIANIARNVLVTSQAVSNDRRGHVMFMHNPNVHVSNVHFYRLGRTDKREVINDPVVDANWNLVPGTGTNPRARYPVHFHRAGTNSSVAPATIDGSVVSDNFGWGFVNHSSNVDMTNNVAYNITGAGFVTEVGDEIGTFHDNIAISIKASGDHIESRLKEQDHGHTGDGFWFQGSGISVVDNVVANAEGHAFVYYSIGLEFGGFKPQFLASNLPDPSIANGASSIPTDQVPVFKFSGNVGYSSKIGLSVWYNLRNASHNAQSIFEDSLFWNNQTGVEVPYSYGTILRNLRIERPITELGTIGVDSNGVTKNITYDNLTVVGYHIGIEAAWRGYSVVNGGTFATRIGVSVRPPVEDGRRVYVQGNFVMVPLPSTILGPTTQRDVVQDFRDLPITQSGTIDHLFYDSKVFLKYGPYLNQQLYAGQQASNVIPFPSSKEYIPSEYVGLTTQQLSALGQSLGKNLTVYGEIAPEAVLQIPTLGGLLQAIP